MIINTILICKCPDLLLLLYSVSLALHPSLNGLLGIYPQLPLNHQWFPTRSGACREGLYQNRQRRNSVSAYALPLPEIHAHLSISPLPSGGSTTPCSGIMQLEKALLVILISFHWKSENYTVWQLFYGNNF